MWKVAELFNVKATLMLVSGTGFSASELLSYFDEPHKLTTIADPLAGEIICLKNEAGYFRRRSAIVRELLHERGIQKGDIEQLGIEEALEIRAISDQRMKAE